MRLDSNVAGIRIGCLGLTPEQVVVGEAGCLLPVETYDVSVSSDLDLIRVPLSRDQGWTSPIVLLAWVLADGDSVDSPSSVFIEAIGISSRQLVDLNLEASIHTDECLVVIEEGHSGQVAIGDRKPWIPEPNENTGVVINSTQLEFQFQMEIRESLSYQEQKAKVVSWLNNHFSVNQGEVARACELPLTETGGWEMSGSGVITDVSRW